MGPASLRRKIGKLIPWKDLHRIFDLVDIMDATSREIYDQKKEALAKGDDAVLQQVGMGKDIMSILRKSPFLLSVFCVARAKRTNISTTVKANALADEADRLPEEELIGQMRFV